MKETIKNGNVKWRVFVLIVTMFGMVLGFLATRIETVSDDIIEIKIDTAVTKERVQNLIDEIRGGEITIYRNGK